MLCSLCSGICRAHPWALSGKGCDNKWCTLHWDAAWMAEAGSSN
jgi:hypothetical protein